MKKNVLHLLFILAVFSAQAQLPPVFWNIAQDTLTPNVFHYHKNLAISNSGLSAALSTRNDIDQIEVYEADGSLRYSKNFGEDMVWYYHVDFSSDDALYLTGNSQPNSPEGSSLRVQKLDDEGNSLWTLNWQETSTDYSGVIRTHMLSDGRLVVCGQFNFYQGNSTNDFYIACVTPDGILDWTYVYSSPGVVVDILRNSTIDENDNIYFTGISQNPSLASFYNLVAGKLTSEGEIEWTIDLDYTNFNGQPIEAASVAVDSNGDVLLGANTYTYDEQNLPLSIPLIARLDGATGNTLNISIMEFDRNTVLKEVITDNSGHYYCSFHSSLDSLFGGFPGPLEFVTYERAHHVQKWNAQDELVWSFDETAMNPSNTVETYNMIWHNDQLLVFHYLDDHNRILVLNTNGTYSDAFSYAKHVIHVGTYQHHILANAHGVYLLTGSLQISQLFRPYYLLVRFGIDPDNISGPTSRDLAIYPNPAQDHINIPSIQPTTNINLFTSNGQRVEVVRNGEQISWAELAPGVYMLEVLDGLQVSHQRLMIE